MAAKTLEIGSLVYLEGFGYCKVLKLEFDGLLFKHYQVRTKIGDPIVICWNGHIDQWVQYSRH